MSSEDKRENGDETGCSDREDQLDHCQPNGFGLLLLGKAWEPSMIRVRVLFGFMVGLVLLLWSR